jgi:hypothetical protein
MTPGDLVEIEQIKRLKYRYCRCIDQKRFDDIAATVFAPDATASYGGGAKQLGGRDDIVGWLRQTMGSEAMLTSHQVSQPEIDLTGPGTATGVWALQDIVVLTELGVTVRGASYYEDRYVKVDGEWRIAHTGYKRLYEEVEPRGENLQLTASWWSTGGKSSLV